MTSEKRRGILFEYARFDHHEGGERIRALEGETASGGRYEVRFANLDIHHATWFAEALLRHAHSLIGAERTSHRSVAERLRAASARLDALLRDGGE